MIKFKKLNADAVIPQRATDGAAGFDLIATHGAWLSPNSRVLMSTGIAAAIPSGYVGLIRARSGLAAKLGIEVIAGVIDSDYRGEIKVALHNIGEVRRGINAGDRIAQMIVIPCLTEAVEVDDLDATVRGGNGFGSTGLKGARHD